MTTKSGASHQSEALARLRKAVAALSAAAEPSSTSTEIKIDQLQEFREAIRLADELLALLEHHVRNPLTVVKGRAQMLRRQQIATTQPDLRLISGLNEIDAAVERIVAQLDRLLGPRFTDPNASAPSDAESR